MAVALVNGKFDILTPAHFALLNHARRYAGLDGAVIVAIDSDERIQKNDPLMPIFDEVTRGIHLRMLKCLDVYLVDHVFYFNTDQGLIDIIKSWRPDYMIKGSDWQGKPVIGSDLVQIIWYPVEKDGISEKTSSSDIINIIKERFNK